MKQILRVSTSQEETEFLQKAGLKEREIIGFFPVDRADCACQAGIKDLNIKFSTMRPDEARAYKLKHKTFQCPVDSKKLKQFDIVCNNCDSLLGKCYASDESLSDWVDLHYYCKSILVLQKRETGEIDKKGKKVLETIEASYWQGALAVNISPIDQKLGFECACGEDTRDFRANQSLPDIVKVKKIKESSKGRSFNEKDSKFIARAS